MFAFFMRDVLKRRELVEAKTIEYTKK